MAAINATPKQLGKGIKIPIGSPATITVVRSLPRVRLTGMFFDPDKCFLLPSAVPGIKGIKAAYDAHPGSNLLIVGHTDTSDQDEPNLALSLERADAMTAFLTDTTAAPIASASGCIRDSRFFSRWSAARRAERGPRPGNRASS